MYVFALIKIELENKMSGIVCIQRRMLLMHWLTDLMAAMGVVLNGIPQGIMAMGLGFAVFPTTI